ncbi:MAG: potassium transporter TrkA [Epsilonproteobacteria bacterium]|nr:potassium transporter TrkA [Campylobacterota bacterium]
MNKILIFAGAKEANLLIDKIIEDHLNLGEFHIIYEDNEIKHPTKEDMFFYKINFYAFVNYKNLLAKDFNKIIVIIKNKEEAKFVLSKIKRYKIPILFVKFWLDFEIPDQNNIEILDAPEIITNKIIDFLPGVPLYARDIGLGIGEILEVEIPMHSPFAYKNIQIFDRYNVRAVAIYRNNELKFVDSNTIILPNDKLILIGDPKSLKDVFHQIKTNIGAFPEPYGKNIYLLIDMKSMTQEEISSLLKSALFLHRKLKNKKLIIKIINPSITSRIYKLFKFSNIDIETDYFQSDYKKALKNDIKKLNIGLIVTNTHFFYKYPKTFTKLKKPILKIGKTSIKKCESLNIILNDKYITKIAPSIFDLSYQLGIKIKFFNVDPENKHPELVEYLQTLAKSFRFTKIEFINKNDNPINILKSQSNGCLVEAIAKEPVSVIRQILFPSVENSYIMLKELNQFLIPIKEEYESNS